MKIIINKSIDNVQDAIRSLIDLRNLIGAITLDNIEDGVIINVEIKSKE